LYYLDIKTFINEKLIKTVNFFAQTRSRSMSLRGRGARGMIYDGASGFA
jgi:hypothetical protein